MPKYCPCFYSFESTFLFIKSNVQNNAVSVLVRWPAYFHEFQAILSMQSSSFGEEFGNTKVLLRNAEQKTNNVLVDHKLSAI